MMPDFSLLVTAAFAEQSTFKSLAQPNILSQAVAWTARSTAPQYRFVFITDFGNAHACEHPSSCPI